MLIRKMFFILFLAVGLFVGVVGCENSGSSNGGVTGELPGGNNSSGGNNSGGEDGGGSDNGTDNGTGNDALTDIDLAANPLSLLGVYNIDQYSLSADGEMLKAYTGSEFRVNIDLKDVININILMRMKLNLYPDTYFTKGIKADLANLNEFIDQTFKDLGAEILDKHTVKFTMTTAVYPELVTNNILSDGGTLIVLMTKVKDLGVSEGVDGEIETPSEINVEGVKFSQNEYNVTRRDAQIALKHAVQPEYASNRNVSYVSSDPSIASVDEKGVVTINSLGSATITITTENGAKIDTCVINVVPVDVESVSIDPQSKEVELNVVKSFKVTATITPQDAEDKTVSFTSSDITVVTVVDNGTVTVVGEGAATITATTRDGGKTAVSNITILPEPVVIIPVTSVTVSSPAANHNVNKGDAPFVVAYVVLPNDASDKSVSFESDDENVATVSDNGTVTIVGGGTATITLKSLNDNNITDSFVINVTVQEESIQIDANKYMPKGGNVNIGAVVLPADATHKGLTYVSDTPSVAIIDADGKITAFSPGTTKVTATSRNGTESVCVIEVFTPVDFTNIKSLEGTYEVTFFGTQPYSDKSLINNIVKTQTVTNNCQMFLLADFFGSGATCKSSSLVDLDKFAGRMTIEVNSSNEVIVTSKMIMTNSTMKKAAKEDQYQYTLYTATNANNPTNNPSNGATVIGVSGRNLTKNTSNMKSPFRIKQNGSDRSSIRIDLDLLEKQVVIGKITAYTKVVSKKLSDTVTALQPNTLADAPFDKIGALADFEDFVETP